MAPNRMFQQLTDKTKKKKKHRPFYEAVDAHARRRLISGPEVADGAKPDVPTTDVENEKKRQNTVYFMKRSTRMRVAA